MSQQRHPEGTSVGGQWAPGASGEVDMDLDEGGLDVSGDRAVYTGDSGEWEYRETGEGVYTRECSRCGGEGQLIQFTQRDGSGGTCFKCSGSGTEGDPVGDLDAVAADADKRDIARAAYLKRKAAKEVKGISERDEHFEQFMASDPTRAQAAEEAASDPELAAEFDRIRGAVRVPAKREELWGAWVEKAIRQRQAKKAAPKPEKAGPPQRHLDAAVGEKVEAKPMRLIRSVDIENDYGPRPVPAKMLVFESESGEVAKLNSSSKAAFAAEVGSTVGVSGEVRSHGDFRGEPQTLLGKPKITLPASE